MAEVLHKRESDFSTGDGTYMLVAVVEADDPDEAFRLTNHLGDGWQENPEVIRWWPELGEGNRSTSVGDLIVANGVIYEVAPWGFYDFPIARAVLN